MKSFFKRVVAGVLLCATIMGGTVALAANTVGDDPILNFPDRVGDTIHSVHMPKDWASKCDTSKTSVKKVKANWLDEGRGWIHVEWSPKAKAKSYEIVISRSKQFRAATPCEYMFSDTNSCTNNSDTSYIFRPHEHKTYYIRVRALYEDGDPGPWSKTLKYKATKANQGIWKY